jgi:hypothetical protein
MDATLKQRTQELASELVAQSSTIEALNAAMRALMKTVLEKMPFRGDRRSNTWLRRPRSLCPTSPKRGVLMTPKAFKMEVNREQRSETQRHRRAVG